MRKFSVLIAMTMCVGGLMAQGGQKPDSRPVPNVSGNWTMTLETPMGTANPSLVLKQDGEKITGSYTGRYGTFALDGSIKERTIVFTFTMNAEGETVPMTFTGEVAADGQTITKGKATLGEMGEAAWSAKKDKIPCP
jgi:hypothetical protein